jgi:fluoroquinolone transport system permease protein
MVILEENDDHIAGYLFVTPLGKRGYLITRLGIPAVLALVVTVILLPVFKLTAISLPVTLLLAVAGAIQGLIIPMLVVSFSSNKLEGMALTKLSSLMMFGILAPFFVKANIQYLLSPLPSFWMAKAIRESNAFYLVISIIISCIWCGFLAKWFIRKTSK